jgi:thiol-disulfide isomerase/thioredoxin
MQKTDNSYDLKDINQHAEPTDAAGQKKPRLSWLAPTLVAAGLATALIVATVSSVRAPETEKGDTDSDASGVAIVGQPAPEFEVDTISGSRFSLVQARGKVVLVNFWGTWCLPCEREMPLLEQASHEFANDLVVVGLAVNDSKGAVVDFVSRKGITFPISLDDGRVAGFYLVSSFPTSVIIGRDGTVVSRVSRAFPSYDDLKAQLLKAIESSGRADSDSR